MSSDLKRRFFIHQLLATVGGAAAISTGLTACSTIDEYLFEDHYNLKDQVLIIGGGLSGLHLAYLLKKNKTEFRLFEGSNRFGGRVRSSQGFDFGASLYSSENKWMQTLIKEFALAPESLDKKNYYFAGGMETLVEHLVERVSGLMPYRNLRLQWQLVSIRKYSSGFELLFETPKGRRTFVSRRVVMAIPPSQWANVTGLLELAEMREAKEWMSALKTENIVKAVIPYGNGNKAASPKSLVHFEDDLFDVRMVNKKTKTSYWSEVDFYFHSAGQSLEIQRLNDFMKKRMNINVSFNKLGTENYFDWRSVGLIGGAYFKNALPWPEMNSSFFQIVGDFASPQSPYTLEGALNSGVLASEKIS